MNISSSPSRPMPVTPRISSGEPSAAMPVTVSPSRRELRRADPSLSFQVSAPGMRFFDVIVATEPALFDPAEAHRRTPKNFRSSRQDFQGLPIEIETGFYMLPRAFIRDVISQEPRPTRLFYLAVGYSDETATDGIYSLPPDRFAEAPFVSLAGDLSAASLSHVLGMAVHRLGSVGPAGRVMAVAPTPAQTPLPRMIGGLPVQAPNPHLQMPVASPQPVSAPPTRAINGPSPVAPGAVNGPAPVAPQPARDTPAQSTAPVAADPAPQNGAPAPEIVAPQPQTDDFIDDDYAYGARSGASAMFRDYDANAPEEDPVPHYDDGLGPMNGAGEAPTATPIPPLDDTPPPLPATGTEAPPAPVQPVPAPTQPTTPAPAPAAGGEGWKDALVQTVLAEGVAGRYEALNLDGAFRGRLGQTHPYYQRAHDGLSLGPHQAGQDSGELGELLTLMQAADPAGFAATFGPAGDQLIAVTTASGPLSGDAPDGRGARVQPVEGRDIWEDPWVERFRKAAQHPPYQAAMRAQIIARRLEPMLPVADALGIANRRGQAMLLTLAILSGVPQAITLSRAAINPFDTPAKLAAALQALGHDSLNAFQTAQGLAPTETLDDASHFALLTALRGLGPEAPVQLPDPDSTLDTLVTSLGPGPQGDALLKLRVSPAFRDNGATAALGATHA
ncbi:hypothetical protein Q5Y75_07190 [Ruegeria sp. 2205SS24-7]|uniref:hypothetical protein n=1 Tax=Ruegeria discodermiae TaxID=3064389 RepID=UPI002741477E|nr:hypothetical protein [Ruegeria sp. 2205SS24-7]MDP5216996.1 hypothetical protein [Ruegeria sp. 2205SS24-7]